MKYSKLVFATLIFFLLAACGAAPAPKSAKNVKKTPKKKSTYYDRSNRDPSSQEDVDDLIYSELSKSQKSMLKKYRMSSSDHSLGGVKFDIPVVRNSRVESWIDYFAYGSGRKHFARWLSRSTRFVPTQLEILKQVGVPKDLIFLSMIESGFNTHAFSSAAASGLWQFIKSTGRLYGLESDYWVDERRDPEKASTAAARHLKDLYQEFGDWYLAFAAYNAGAGKVRRAIEATGSRDFWVLASSPYLRQETKDYVPKMLAAAIIGKSLEKYGFTDVDFQDAVATEKATITSPTDLGTIAECTGVETDFIRLLNPELIRNMTPPNASSYEINLPRGTKRQFESRYARLDKSDRLKNVTYVARRGDTLRTIAAENGVSVSTLVSANPSLDDGNRVDSGTRIFIPRAYTSAPEVALSTSPFSRGNRLVDLIAGNRPEERATGRKGSKKRKEQEDLKANAKQEITEKSSGEMKVASKENSSETTTEEKKLSRQTVADQAGPEKIDSKNLIASEGTPVVKPERPNSATDLDFPQILAGKKTGKETTEEKSTDKTAQNSKTEEEKSTPEKSPADKPSDAPADPTALADTKEVKPETSDRPVDHQTDRQISDSIQKISKTTPKQESEDKVRPEASSETSKEIARETHSQKAAGPKNSTNKTKEKIIAHKVKSGENLTEIADRYDVSISQLKEWNPSLKKQKNLLKDQKLTIRSTAVEPVKIAKNEKSEKIEKGKKEKPNRLASKKPEKEKNAAKEKAPKLIAYKVRKGDTLEKIARMHEVSASQILKLNKMKASAIRPGVVLKIKS